MNETTSLECKVHFRRRSRGRRELVAGAAPEPPVCEPGRTPRVARLAALALRFEKLVREGEVDSFAHVAELGRVSRARISQITNLLCLAPDVLEAVLFLPRTRRGRDPIHLRLLQPIAATFDWRKQRRLWKDLTAARSAE